MKMSPVLFYFATVIKIQILEAASRCESWTGMRLVSREFTKRSLSSENIAIPILDLTTFHNACRSSDMWYEMTISRETELLGQFELYEKKFTTCTCPCLPCILSFFLAFRGV